ncbi:MAG TPA: PHB depolymerase family esterase [Acidimicrobiales bacterium]|nr:PHB depolymerase family esterase [Acidimicrobiales bacterium]
MGAEHRLPPRSARLILAGLLAAGCTAAGGGAEDGTGIGGAGAPDGCDERRPLVVDLHGYSETTEQHEQRTGWHAQGAESGFVTFSPQAGGQPSRWDLEVDPAVLRLQVEAMVEADCVDPDRVYVTGHSMGGFMVSRIACELSDVVAAVAPVAGVLPVEDCAPVRPVPALVVHGRADTTVPLTGGLSPAAAHLLDLPERGPSIRAITADWAARNGCGALAASSVEGVVAVERFPCPEGAEVELRVIDGAGHEWPAGVTAAIWEFLAPYRLTSVP